MKILYLCKDNLAKKRGSMVHMIEIARNLKRLGAEVLIIAPSVGRFKEKDLKIQYVPTLNIGILRPLSFRISLSLMLCRRLLFHDVDIIYVREFYLYLMPFILGKIFKKPTVIEVNNALMDGAGLKFFIRKISFKLADRIIVANRHVKELLSKEYSIDKDKFAIIPMGVNTDLFRPMDKYKCRETVKLKNDYKYIGFIGTLFFHQGLRYLVEAAPSILKKDNGIKFLIVGSGIDEKHIKDLVRKKRLSENFIFTGEKEYNEIPYYINSSDVCISLVTPERGLSFSFPLKIYEYLACGRPVVIGNLKNLSELLNRSSTPIINPADPKTLSEAIFKILENADSLKDESENLRKLVTDRFSWKETAGRTLDLFNSITPK